MPSVVAIESSAGQVAICGVVTKGFAGWLLGPLAVKRTLKLQVCVQSMRAAEQPLLVTT